MLYRNANTHTCTHIYPCIHTHVHVGLRTYIHTMDTYIYSLRNSCMHTRIHTSIRKYIHMHAYPYGRMESADVTRRKKQRRRWSTRHNLPHRGSIWQPATFINHPPNNTPYITTQILQSVTSYENNPAPLGGAAGPKWGPARQTMLPMSTEPGPRSDSYTDPPWYSNCKPAWNAHAAAAATNPRRR